MTNTEHPRPTYGQQCRKAASAQGLDPIMAKLTAEAVPFDLRQTGGFCMLVRVALRGDEYIGITADSEDFLLVVRYENDEDPIGTVLIEDRPAEQAYTVVREAYDAALAVDPFAPPL